MMPPAARGTLGAAVRPLAGSARILRVGTWRGILLLAMAAACGGGGGEHPFTVALPYAHDSLDPHGDGTLRMHMAPAFNIYEALVEADADLRLQPGLAQSWSTVGDNRWIFELREARFHSGRPLTAADVVFSLRRAAEAAHDTSYYLQDVESVREVGPRTVEIRTRGPAPRLLNRLGFVMIVPAGATDLAARADGTGAYRVTGWEPGRRLDLRRHEGWWKAPPAVESASLQFGVAGPDAEGGLLDGRFQVTQFVAGFNPARVAASPDHHLAEEDDFYVTYLAWNLGRAPLSDRRVRDAVALAVSREALAARLPRRARPASQLVSRHVFGYDAALGEDHTDPQRAQALLATAGFPAGLDLVLTVRERYRDAAAILRQQLGHAGFRVVIEVESDARYFQRLKKHDLQLWLDNWGCTTGDAAELFENALHSPVAGGPYGGFNETGYANPELDRRIAAVTRLEGDPRREALQGLMRTVLEDRVLLPLYSEVDAYGIGPGIRWRPRADAAIRVADIMLEER
jgi:peptide/nickel transport system substrate-binding protein